MHAGLVYAEPASRNTHALRTRPRVTAGLSIPAAQDSPRAATQRQSRDALIGGRRPGARERAGQSDAGGALPSPADWATPAGAYPSSDSIGGAGRGGGLAGPAVAAGRRVPPGDRAVVAPPMTT
ncbi:hypothetical protein MTO96_047743 [Rhipicephalus appendiculatus]